MFEIYAVVTGSGKDVHNVILFDHQISAESWLENNRGSHEWLNLYGPCAWSKDVTDAPMISMAWDGQVKMWRGEKI